MQLVGSASAAAPLWAALASGVVALVVLGVNAWHRERDRRRRFYADALALTFDYREFAYAVRRRRHDVSAEERVRLSEAMREVQRGIAHHEALMQIERAPRVYATYKLLVSATRRVAGGYVREAWKTPPITEDTQMNIDGIDFSELDSLVTAYLGAVEEDLTISRWWR